MSKNLRLDIKQLRKEILVPMVVETKKKCSHCVAIEINNLKDFIEAVYENELTYEKITEEIPTEKVYKYRNLVLISHLVLNKEYTTKRAIELFRVFLHAFYLVCKDGHTGFSINYVIPFLKTCIKKNTPCEMLDDDEYGNIIRKNVNDIFQIIKQYKVSYNLTKKEINDLLHILEMIIKNEPLVAASLAPHSFDSLAEFGDNTSRQHSYLSSLFMDLKAPKQVYYSDAIVFKYEYKDENGKSHNSAYTGNTSICKGSNIKISSSAYIKKEHYKKMCAKGEYNFPRFYINVSTDENGDHYITNLKDIKKIKKFYNIRYYKR